MTFVRPELELKRRAPLAGGQPGTHEFVRTSTVVVGFSDTCDFQCNGVADDVEIQAAIDYVEALGGGEVKLLQGTFVQAATINIMVDNVNLAGCGTATILSGAIDVNYITVGDGATTLTGIVIRNLAIDGTLQTNGEGISFYGGAEHEIMFSWITECYVHNSHGEGIALDYTLHSSIENNICEGNRSNGIFLDTSNNNTVVGNTCQGNDSGILLYFGTFNNTMAGNTCNENTDYGIFLVAGPNDNTLTGNTCLYNTNHNIYLSTADRNVIVGNNCSHSDTGDGIRIKDSYANLITGNVCDHNAGYGVNIYDVDCWYNRVETNQLLYNTTGPFNDDGTLTGLASKTFQFTEPLGGAAWQDTSPAGIVVDAADEGGLALGWADIKVQMVVRFRVAAVCLAPTGAGKGMLLEINVNAGKPKGSEPFNAETIACASVISTENNVLANDAIEWLINASDDEDIGDIDQGETIEIFALYEADGADDDIATNIVLRTVTMEYV